MKAAVYRRYGPPEVLRAAEVPKPDRGRDELLVRVRMMAFALIFATAVAVGLTVGFETSPLLGVIAGVVAPSATAALLAAVCRSRRATPSSSSCAGRPGNRRLGRYGGHGLELRAHGAPVWIPSVCRENVETGVTGLEPATSGVTGRYRLNRYDRLPPELLALAGVSCQLGRAVAGP
jgi:hypothetical protein